MEYRFITTPMSGIPSGETVECDSYDLVAGRLVRSGRIPVFGLPPSGHEASKSAMVAYVAINNVWAVYVEDC